MKKFKFNLEALLVMRGWEEQRARQAMSEANAHVNRLNARIDEMKFEVDRAYAGWQSASSGKFTPAERIGLASQVAEIQARSQAASQELADARQRCAQAMKALRSASQAKKVVESLKDRRYQEYSVELQKQEATEIEDVFNARRSAL